jgi:alkylated DNA nucleotide flippase Atl1/5'(3')-deoxyribonucleotidase
MKKVVAIDIDEVLSAFHEPFLMHHNRTYGTAYTYPDTENRYYLEEFTGEPSEIVEKKIHEFVQTPVMQDAEPLPGAQAALDHLRQLGYELVVITARPPMYKPVTDRFMERHFPDVFQGVHAIPHFVGSALTPAAGKLALCQQLGAQYLIDDNLGTATVVADAGMQAIVFGEYHWNQAEILPKGVVRCKDWNAVKELFMESETDPNFRQRVEAIVAQIPQGRVMTYGQLAGICGNARAARIVGSIAHFGDPNLPWQRVVNKSGGLASGYPGGRQGHAEHLRAEGITVSQDQTVNVASLLWWPAGAEPKQQGLF